MGKKNKKSNQNYWDDEPSEPVQPQEEQEVSFSPKSNGKKGKKGKKGKNITHNGFSTGAFGVLGGGDEDDSMCQLDQNSSDTKANTDLNNNQETYVVQEQLQDSGEPQRSTFGSRQNGFGGSRQSGIGGSQQEVFGGSQQDGFRGSQQDGFGGSKHNGFGGSQQNSYGGSQYNGFGGSQQNGFGGSQQNEFAESQQNGFGGSQRSGFGGSQQNDFGESQQNGFGGSQQNGFGGSRQSGFGGSRKNSISGSQQNGFGGSQQNGFGGSQQNAFGGSQQNAFGGSQLNGFSGSQQNGFGGSQHNAFGGSQQNDFSGSPQNGSVGSQQNVFSGSQQDGFGESQQNDFAGSQQNGFVGSQEKGFGGSQQNGFGGSQQNGFDGSQQDGFGGSQQNGFGGSQQNGFGGSQQNGFGGSQQNGFGGSQQNEFGGSQRNGFGGSRQSAFGGSRQSGFGGSRQSGFHEEQQNRESQKERFGGSQASAFGGSRQSGFGSSHHAISNGSHENEASPDDFVGSQLSGFDESQKNPLSGSRRSGFSGSQHDGFHESNQNGLAGSHRSVYGSRQSEDFNGFVGSQDNIDNYKEEHQIYEEELIGNQFSTSRGSLHHKSIDIQRSRCSSVSQTRASLNNLENTDQLSHGRSHVSIITDDGREISGSLVSSQTNLADKFLQPVPSASRRSSVSIHDTKENEERYGSFVNPRRASTASYQEHLDQSNKPSIENVYEQNVVQFNQMLGVERNHPNRFGSCQFGSDFDQQINGKHVSKSTHTLHGHDFYDKRNQPLVKSSRNGSHVSFSGNARFPSDGDEAEGMDDFSETQVQLRSMMNDEKCTNHRLSRLSINTNADEFVLVGGQPPPGVVDGRASCPAGRSRRSRKMMRSTDFLTDQNEQMGGSIRSTSAMSRQSLRSTNEHELKNIGIEEEEGDKFSNDFNRPSSHRSGVSSRAVSNQSVDNFVTACEYFENQNYEKEKDDKSSSSQQNEEVNIPFNCDETKKSSDVLESKMMEHNVWGSRKSVASTSQVSYTEDNFYRSRMNSQSSLRSGAINDENRSRQPSQISLRGEYEQNKNLGSRSVSRNNVLQEVHIPYNAELGCHRSDSNVRSRSVSRSSALPEVDIPFNDQLESHAENNLRSRSVSRSSALSEVHIPFNAQLDSQSSNNPRSRSVSQNSAFQEISIPYNSELNRTDNFTRSRSVSHSSATQEVQIPFNADLESRKSSRTNLHNENRPNSQVTSNNPNSDGSRRCSRASSHVSMNRENGDDTEENLLIADYNSRIESHWDLGPSSRSASALSGNDKSHYQNIPDIVIIPPEEAVNQGRPIQKHTPPALRKARMRSKSSVDIGKNFSNDEVPQPMIFTDALTPQSVAPRSRIQKNKPDHKNCEIAIQTGETIRLRQMTDFSNFESSTDFQPTVQDEQSNPLVYNRRNNQHPAAAVINNFFQQQSSLSQTESRSNHQVTMIQNDVDTGSIRSAPRDEKSQSTKYYHQTRVEDIPKKPWEVPGAVEIVPKEIAAEMRDQVLAEAKQPQTPNSSKIQKSKFDEFEKYSREDNSYDSSRNEKRNYTSQSNGSNSSGVYRWNVNNPKAQKRLPDVKWSDNPRREPGCTVRESIKAGQIRNLASMFNNMQAKAKEEEAVLRSKSSFTSSQDENNNEVMYAYDRHSHNNSDQHLKYIPNEYQYQDRKAYLNEHKYYPAEPMNEKHHKSWVYSNDIDGALMDVNEESEHGSVIDRYRTSTPLHDYVDHDNITSQFCRIPSIRSDEPPVTVSRHPSSLQRVPSKASDKQFSGRYPVHENNQNNNHYSVVDKLPKNSGDYAEICYMYDSPRSKRSTIDRSKASSGDNNGYSAIRDKSSRTEQSLQRRPSRGGEYATLSGSQKSKFGSIVEETVNEQIDHLFGFVDEQSKQPRQPPQSKQGLHYSISTYRAMQRSNKANEAPIRFSPSVAPHASELSECSISCLNKRNSNASNYGLVSAHRFGGRPADLVASTPKSSPTHRAPPALEESYVSSISEGSRHEEKMNEYKKQFNKLVHQLEMCQEQMDMTQKALLKARKEKKQLLEVTAQRSILIASQRAILLKRELQNIQAVLQLRKQPPFLNHDLRGSMSISNITLHLNRGISQRITDNSSFVFVVLLKSGSELEATIPVTLLINYQSPVKLQFTEKISFHNLPIDFSVELEVYVMVLPEVKNDENSCATTIANKCRNLLGPGRKAHSSTGLPVGEFVRGGYLRLDRETTSFEKFYLDDAQYPLEGTISVTSSCTSLPHAIEVDYRGFLTMYQSIAGGSWERYWAVLRRGSIYFWKYPDEDAMGKPPRAYLKLQSCTKDVITPCTLDQCARSYTFSIEILVNTTPSNIEKKRIVLAADSREFMCAWIEAINETLSVIREH